MDFVFRWTCFSCFFRSVPNEAKDRYDESTGSEERERERERDARIDGNRVCSDSDWEMILWLGCVTLIFCFHSAA